MDWGGCLKSEGRVSRGCQVVVCRLGGGYLEDVVRLSGGCVLGVR